MAWQTVLDMRILQTKNGFTQIDVCCEAAHPILQCFVPARAVNPTERAQNDW